MSIYLFTLARLAQLLIADLVDMLAEQNDVRAVVRDDPTQQAIGLKRDPGDLA